MKGTDAARFDWPEQTFAEEVARSQDGDTILFRVSVPLSVDADWSVPLRFRFKRRDDGTYSLLMTEAGGV